MPRKRKAPRVIEDVSDALLKCPCSNPECGYQIEKPGRWFDKANHFICPDCRHYTALDHKTVLRIKAEYVKRLGDAFESLGWKLGDK